MSTPGVAVYSACTPCAHRWLPHAEEVRPGWWTGIAHASHAAELVALGWIRTPDPDPREPDDVTCEHYHQAHWEGGHNGCCGMDG